MGRPNGHAQDLPCYISEAIRLIDMPGNELLESDALSMHMPCNSLSIPDFRNLEVYWIFMCFLLGLFFFIGALSPYICVNSHIGPLKVPQAFVSLIIPTMLILTC